MTKGDLLKAAIVLAIIVPGIFIAIREEKEPKEVIKGDISFYGNKLAGERTASGEVFDPKELTAAHPHLPIGSKVEVENMENNKKVTVEINDRGPYAADRKLDVSKKAAEKLNFVKKGETRAKRTVLEKPEGK